jgi:hypothetical protein
MLKIEFATDNAAFGDPESTSDWHLRAECSRVLRRIADQVLAGTDDGRIMDANGNQIGKWSLL